MRNKHCKRCGSDIVDDRCTDITCLFNHHKQSCEAGWNGHPEIDPHPNDDDIPTPCTCQLKTFVCEFCGVYDTAQPICNRCEEEKGA